MIDVMGRRFQPSSCETWWQKVGESVQNKEGEAAQCGQVNRRLSVSRDGCQMRTGFSAGDAVESLLSLSNDFNASDTLNSIPSTPSGCLWDKPVVTVHSFAR